jgi:hypothetical protein
MMHRVLIPILLLLALALPRTSTAQPAQVTIDRIVQDNVVSGHVTGVNPAARSHYIVVLYVHTDIWYIHPYAGQGKGKSWATIDADGSWSIETIKRRFDADQVAALVITDQTMAPPRTESVQSIPNVGLTIKNLQGTQDFGKL